MRILLISPRWSGYGNRKKVKVREGHAHPLTLGIIAALSEGHEVRIINEHLQEIPFREQWDLVGITCATYTAPRAYEIGDTFRSQGIRVVMGGVHPTLMPDECLQHCDSVVRGEVEGVWQGVLRDTARQDTLPIYEGGTLEDMSLIPNPGRKLFATRSQSAVYFQATRGCAGTCEFCYLHYVGWGAHRKRPIGQVIDELKSIKQRYILIVDDNLFVDRDYALELLGEMAGLGKYWWAQGPTTMCFDDELLQAVSRAGCFALSIGFQTINKSSLDQAKITQNRVERYCDAVGNVHRHKILVDGTFIFGFDPDPPTIFEDTVKAIREMKLDAHTFYMLTPYPGTPYYQRLESEGRIIDRNLSHYDWDHVVIEPAGMSCEQLETGVEWAYNTLDASWPRWVLSRIIRNSWIPMRSLRLAWFLFRQNFPQRYRVNY